MPMHLDTHPPFLPQVTAQPTETQLSTRSSSPTVMPTIEDDWMLINARPQTDDCATFITNLFSPAFHRITDIWAWKGSIRSPSLRVEFILHASALCISTNLRFELAFHRRPTHPPLNGLSTCIRSALLSLHAPRRPSHASHQPSVRCSPWLIVVRSLSSCSS